MKARSAMVAPFLVAVTGAAQADEIALTPVQLFDLAAQAVQKGDVALAEKALRALCANREVEVRSEARFRLAMLLLDPLHRPRDAAVLLRQILDEKPNSARVRVELARIQAMLGHTMAASAQLRAAHAAGLPPAVEREVRFFMQAMDARRHVGGSAEATLMPDSNANRATNASIIGTRIGDLSLSSEARRHSGIGANLRGQAYARLDLAPSLRLLTTLSAAATLYRNAGYDDIALAPAFGPELSLNKDRVTLQLGPSWRWYGQRRYSSTLNANAVWAHTLGRRAQLRTEASMGDITNHFDGAQSGQIYALGLGLDRAVSPRLGAGVQANAFRQTAQSATYAYTGASGSAHIFREIGPMTLLANLSYSHLEADQGMALFSRRRVDNMAGAMISMTVRQIHIANVSPVFRIRYENNRSTLAIYEYSRVAGEIGLSARF
ncbi:surface lipoprotein assembly modifier [Novosphingobium sp. KACC 22771]|uniref:surface lipoprotein assembly modifier n=1 Tax=Novosphingobium sp. KACC 22771 TaxID=3025670 RepID=UPI0023655241|nr:surface lipoprotein assembly modifier [Novosphingobium sp. KACC 22771]WDF72756.1 surface lipoprotein assembly modifier [Novosphingobium sp. KACC 22771]